MERTLRQLNYIKKFIKGFTTNPSLMRKEAVSNTKILQKILKIEKKNQFL